MSDSFFSYIDRLQIMGFFVAYPLIYFFSNSILASLKNERLQRIPSLLPYSYALIGTLYLGLLLKDLYPDFSSSHIDAITHLPYLKIWGLLSLLFWIPKIAQRPIFSLLHSLVFFYFLVKDLYRNSFGLIDKSIVQNDMRIFTDSLLLNIATLVFIFLISLLYTPIKRL